MKRCYVHPVLSFFAYSAALAVMTGVNVVFCRLLENTAALVGENHWVVTFAAMLFVLVTVVVMRRALEQSRAYLEYDDFQVVFHFSNHEIRTVQWSQFAETGAPSRRWNGLPLVAFQRGMWGCVAVFQDNGRRMPVYRFSSGYHDFIQTLQEKGVLQ